MKKRLALILMMLLVLQCLFGCTTGQMLGKDGTDAQEAPVAPCPSKEAHTDADDNGFCDKCRSDVTVTLSLYAVNDLHGKIADSDNNAGVDELTAYLRKCVSVSEAAVLLSSGDSWQGSAESNSTKGLLATDWMNELGFVSMTLGNHEFDWGSAQIEANREIADFPFLAINIFEKETNARPDYCAPSVMVQRGDLTVGIIGAIGDCYSSISADQVEDVYFATGEELALLVMDESKRLREAGADFIVYSLHDGHDESTNSTVISTKDLMSYYDPRLSKDGYVDLVFEGHTHRNYAMKDVWGVYHLQGGGDNKGISHVEVEINYVTDSWVVYTGEYLPSKTYLNFEDDPIIAELLAKYDELIAPIREVLGQNKTSPSSDRICHIVAELYCALGESVWGQEYNIFLGGGFLQLRSPYSIPTGEVIYADLQMILPFDNRLLLCSISGADLERRFLQSNNSIYYISLGDYGAQNSTSIDPNATYYVVVDSYTAQYAPNRLTVVKEYTDGVYARDLLADFIRKGGLE